ncbi:hypothetical protein GIB67_017785 [Kingdonia uniflora]|uniref:Uncharacterized protein n=1 Tax=Kingdonia uniflora TaxID=39325 RepID=A0A7J7MNY7_9MAGN|nr:hypothetical protein GIB67_017785 [Kingdonia uniflora]
MPEEDPHPSTLPGFRVTRDPKRAVTRSRSGRKKKRVEFEDVQQPIPNPPEENYPHRLITQLPYGVTHIYYTGKELTRPWLESAVSKLDDVRRASLLSRTRMPLQVPNGNCEYYLGDRCWRQLTGTAGILLDTLLNMSPHLSLADLQAMRWAGFVDCEQFVIREEQETYASYWANQIVEDLHLRKGRDVRVVPVLPGGGARMRQRRSGPLTRGGGSSCRRRGTGDNFDPSK